MPLKVLQSSMGKEEIFFLNNKPKYPYYKFLKNLSKDSQSFDVREVNF